MTEAKPAPIPLENATEIELRKKRAAYMREWRAKNLEKMLAYERARRERTRQKIREWDRTYRAANAEKFRKQEAKRYLANIEKHREYDRRRYRDNPERRKPRRPDIAYRARKAGVSGQFTRSDWNALVSRSPCCYWCRRPWTKARKPTHDHIIPIAKGGPNSPENAVCACLQCNQSKGSRRINPKTGQGILL